MPSEFVHLHFHSHFSLLDGATKVKGLGKHLTKIGYDTCALTDHGNLYGAIQFHDEMRSNGIKPIIGMEAYVAKGEDRFQRSYQRPGPNAYHLVLLCQNMEGYKNLIKMASFGFRDGKYYGKPRIDRGLLEKHNKGLIALSACIAGEIGDRILGGNEEGAREAARWYKDVFDGRYYLELQENGLPQQDKVNPIITQMARDYDIPMIGTCDCHYTTKDQAYPQYILQLMGWQKKVTDPDVRGMNSAEFYIKTPEEIKEAFKNLPPECITNSRLIADQCELNLSTKKLYLPEYPVESNRSLDDEMIFQSKEGLKERLKYLKILYKWSDEELEKQRVIYNDRLDYELGIINGMGFPGYFLIVSDFIIWSKKNNIPVGPGRGSGAGSLVAYAMKITDIDPIEFDLLFERFLNPERVSMPDFDIDFEVEGRERVIDYVREKYGHENVAQISAIGSLKAKGVIRGVARVLGFSFAEANEIVKLVPDDLGINLTKMMEMEPKFKEIAENGTEDQKKLIKIAFDLEGVNNNLSTHAAGVIIMDTPVYDVMPTCTPTKGHTPQSMYTMKYAEAQGAVKFDFLGLRNLSIIDKTVQLINSHRPKDDQLDISLISLEDPLTYELLCRADTTGVFQLESSGMKGLIKKLKPDCFEDIIALVALYRPGPLGSGMVDDYVEVKHGRQEPKYPHPLLEPVLKETHGVMVYQEQVMRSVQVLADFSLGGADLLRRAIGKKIQEILDQQRNKFAEGCAKKGISEEKSTEIFNLIDKFAGYGFNKSHSAAYALVSYQTAWLKANYPVEFMAALLSIERNKPESVVKLISECREMGIPVLPPDINISEMIFTTDGKEIRFGLNAIKNVGEAALESILQARKECGKFETLMDIFRNIDTSKVNSRVLEALIKSGVFDSLEPIRRRLMEGIDEMLNIATAEKAMNIEGHLSFFDMLEESEQEKCATKIELPNVPEWKQKLKLKLEKEGLGFYISGHPLAPYEKELKTYAKITNTCDIKNLVPAQDNSNGYRKRVSINIAGVIVSKQVRLTKKNTKMAILVVEDQWGSTEVLAFQKTYDKYTELLEQEEVDDPVFITGTIMSNDKGVSVSADSFILLPQLRTQQTHKIKFNLDTLHHPSELQQINEIINKSPGTVDVSMFITAKEENCRVDFKTDTSVEISEQLIDELEEILPPENILYKYEHHSKEDSAQPNYSENGA